MATSLMNDSAYAYDINTNLIAMAEVVFIDKDMREIISSMLIDDNDIEQLLK